MTTLTARVRQLTPHEIRRFIVVSFACVLAALGAVIATHNALAQGDNAAVAINTRDNSNVFTLSFKILRLNSDVATPSNIAFAYASCSSCQTVAISIEAVFVMADPSVASPSNYAIAYNFDCNQCDTLASAYQYFDTVGGAFRITPEGEQQIAQIRQQLEALRQCGCDILTIQAQITTLTAELQQVLETQVVPVGPSASPSASTAPSPGSTPSESPSSGASPSPSPGASPSETPSSVSSSPSP